MTLNKEIVRKFEKFEQRCFKLIIEAYQISTTEKVIQLNWNENDISYILYEKIDENPKRVQFKIHIAPEFRIPKDVPKIKGFADKLPRIDLRMSNFAKKQEFKYYFEAKRLKEKSSELKRAYIKEGMDRFISEKYPMGCMLGYLLEGKVDNTRMGINSLLEKDGRNTEILTAKSHNLHKEYYESEHKTGILKHLIFDFTKI
ncbi:hypothetical protein AGMMS49965_23050 [Bacteroidia bacterium]|nr:hypothetical protein AGMMS49965_23050 [Bacteroidia bacterium]